jgi:hypothetical protein
MTRLGGWLTSAAVVGGVAGGSVIGLTSGATTVAATKHTPPTPAASVQRVTALQHEVDALLAEDAALRKAVAQARARLARQVSTSEASLHALERRLAQTQASLAAAQGVAPTTSRPASTVAPAPPSTHATSGASGAGSSSSTSSDDGGHDD